MTSRRDTNRTGLATALSARKLDNVVSAFCRNCDHNAEVDLARIVARGFALSH
ncbi:hypothetical protein [Acidisphaera sp. S103]|uniref:hypothetical protein n=1 Tax=Acidisphaera sp. S103 TaxID=1747223 RepID=UPI00131C3365|nr:hypothetical protein [Acidisphaera sp. S103]